MVENTLTEKEIDELLHALCTGEIDIEENEDNNLPKQRVLMQREIDSLISFYENAKKTAQKSQSILDNINLDSVIKVKLTNLGRDIYYRTVDECVENAKKIGISKEILRIFDDEVDTNGYTEFSLKSFMTIFGNYAYEDIIKGNIGFISSERKNNNFYERICTYCQYRHDLCCNNEKVHKAFETRDCPEFVLGKCFSCSVRKSNNNNFVDGTCQSFDYEGCVNFKM